MTNGYISYDDSCFSNRTQKNQTQFVVFLRDYAKGTTNNEILATNFFN